MNEMLFAPLLKKLKWWERVFIRRICACDIADEFLYGPPLSEHLVTGQKDIVSLSQLCLRESIVHLERLATDDPVLDRPTIRFHLFAV